MMTPSYPREEKIPTSILLHPMPCHWPSQLEAREQGTGRAWCDPCRHDSQVTEQHGEQMQRSQRKQATQRFSRCSL